jgi:predicted transcriptional regulator of viral defense system
MKKIDAIKTLQQLDKRGIYVLAQRDLAKLFPNEQEKALEKSLQRLVADGILQRVTRGIYINPAALSKKSHAVEQIAAALRPGQFSYVSLESALSEMGAISQIPVSRITIMTTGLKGEYKTPYGTIEFTHTKRRPLELVKRTTPVPGRPLRMATQDAALQDLRRVGRNVRMISVEDL